MKTTVFSFLIVLSQLYSQWQPDVRLSYIPFNSHTSLNNSKCIASSGNVVHVLWTGQKPIGAFVQIYYKRSTDGGINWSTDTAFTSNSWYFTGHPSISISGSNVHITWIYNHNAYGQLFYKHSTDGGVSWGANKLVTNSNNSLYFSSVAVSGSFVHIVTSSYFGGNPGQVFYSKSENEGSSWQAITPLSGNPTSSLLPSISASGSTLNVLWQDIRDGNWEIYSKRSTDNGLSWGSERRQTNNPLNSNYPCISSAGLLLHAVWQDNRDGNYEIYYKRSTDGGLSWGTDIRLTNNSDSSFYPSITSSGSNVHIAWQDYRNGNWEIYYIKSTNSGNNWETETRLTNNPAVSITPSIAVSGTTVYVLWSDNRDGNYEIYFKRNPTGNPVGIKNINTEVPDKFSLSQNYPNPFNPATKIRFSLPLPSKGGVQDVKLVIYNILGREIATLVNEQLQPGTYEIEWNAGNFASGVYYYKLISNGFTETKKMIYIK